MSRLAALVLLVTLGCASARSARRELERALPPGATGPLEALEDRVPSGQSGFKLLAVNEEALRWRLALIDSAQHSLDVMTFLWWGDASGDLVMSRVLAAADRGVKVRLIVDDLSTISDGIEVKLRDVTNAAVDAHPNVELRVFNPWNARGAAGRAVELVIDFKRLNKRMHNKALVADNHAAIVGGRNIGDEYFGLNTTFNFHDVDVLAVGPAARQASSVFDHYWNGDWVTPVTELTKPSSTERLASERAVMREKVTHFKSLERFQFDPRDWSQDLSSLALYPGESTVATDVTGEKGVEHRMRDLVSKVLASARREILVSNAYVIPTDDLFAEIARELKEGVRFVMLTNSLGSTDTAGVHAHYSMWRPRLVVAGLELFEFKHDAVFKAEAVDTAPVQGGFVSLHAKVMVVDRARVLFGSMNLDPRSLEHNTEMGMVIECPALANEVAAMIERTVQPENAWRVVVDRDGEVMWSAGKELLREAPAREGAQRSEELMHRLLPADQY